ncbi:MAG: 3-hydroxyacyl-ACP dehydratase FabZ family protein [Sandaracinaceae bacterium]
MDPDELTALMRAGRRRPIWEPQEQTTRMVDHGRTAVERLLPHRDPFLFVDRITRVDLEQRALTAWRAIDSRDPVFVGHFPSYPIYPGVLLLETMGQAGICLAHFVRRSTLDVGAEVTPVDVRALKIHSALFIEEVGPGAELTIEARLLSDDSMTAVCVGQIRRGSAVAAVAVMEVYFVGDEA